MVKEAEQVIADTERVKIAFKDIIERAIKLNVKGYTDIITFDPPLNVSTDEK
jgi:hypothetical protein